MDVVPETGQLAQVMVQSTAPAFILGAVAGFVSILLGRMTNVIDRVRSLNESLTTIPFGPTLNLIFRACGGAPNF